MNYKLYYLNFTTPVHIGAGNLWDSEYYLYADTLFSALCHEALAQGVLDTLVQGAQEGTIVLSDAMPHIKKELFVPKPMCKVNVEQEGNSTLKKSYKKLKYISLANLSVYLNGTLNPEQENKKIKSLGVHSVETRVNLREKDDALPYRTGAFTFAPENGLYCIVGVESSAQEALLQQLLQSLQYTGIGGKISSGYGKFVLKTQAAPTDLVALLQGQAPYYIALTSCMATPDELETCLEHAQYRLVKRSGFVHSKTYANTPMRKKDFFAFAAGACFVHPFKGDIFDVSGQGAHPVYRYAKPLWLGVQV